MSDKIGSPLTLVGYEDNVDLRNISWNQHILDEEAKRWELAHGQAVVYSNVAKSKVRLIAVFYGLAVLILPPIDPADKVSLYLKINQFLYRFRHKGQQLLKHLELEIEDAQERLERAQVRREMAQKAAKKRKTP